MLTAEEQQVRVGPVLGTQQSPVLATALCSQGRRRLGFPEVHTAAKTWEEADLRLQAAHPELTAHAPSPRPERPRRARGRRGPLERKVGLNSERHRELPTHMSLWVKLGTAVYMPFLF